jgi:hypothetical protein
MFLFSPCKPFLLCACVLCSFLLPLFLCAQDHGCCSCRWALLFTAESAHGHATLLLFRRHGEVWGPTAPGKERLASFTCVVASLSFLKRTHTVLCTHQCEHSCSPCMVVIFVPCCVYVCMCLCVCVCVCCFYGHTPSAMPQSVQPDKR